MIQNKKLEKIINKKLHHQNFNDYTPNGLQVEGREIIEKVITGVTANQALLERAVQEKADAIIVHHGYFWKNEPLTIQGIKRCRLKILLENEINLYSWHLPLDLHPEIGNNVQLANLLGINVIGNIKPLLLYGELSTCLSGLELSHWIEKHLNRVPLWYGETGSNLIKRVAWCTGAGQDFIDNVSYFNIDAFITGEVSENTIHSAQEQGLHFYAAGHHATERGGISALTDWLKKKLELDVRFVDIFNPI